MISKNVFFFGAAIFTGTIYALAAPPVSQETIERAATATAASMEKRGMVSLAYKHELVPRRLYASCVRLNTSYLAANNCVDEGVLALPSGSVPGTWRLDANSQARKRAFWSLAECDSARVWNGGGVCVSN